MMKFIKLFLFFSPAILQSVPSSIRQHGFLMLNGRCVAECPAERYYRGKSGRHEACIPCYYTCRTCSGSNDYEVSSANDQSMMTVILAF